MNHASEQELIAQAIAGDQVAIHRLLMLHHDRIAAVLAKKIPPELGGALSPEDVCQEAYIAAVRELGSFQPRGENALFNWLMTIAERKLIDAIRALRAAKRGGDKKAIEVPARCDMSSIAAFLERVAVHERTPSRSAADHELVSAVQRALGELKEDYRAAIRYKYIDGLSAAETAARMGRSEGAVLKLCERGLQQLTEVIGDASRFFSRKP